MNSIYFVSQLITLLRKKEKFKNNSVWVDWNEIIKEVYRNKFNRSELTILIYSGEAEYQKIGELENSKMIFLEFNDNEKREIIELLSLFHKLLKNEKDVLFESRINQILNEFKIHLNKAEIESIDYLIEKWINKKIEEKFFYKIKLPATLRFVILDFIIRWICLWTMGNEEFIDYIDNSELASYKIDSGLIFLLTQFLLIPILILSIAYLRNSKIEKGINNIFTQLGQTNLKISFRHSPWNYLISFSILVIGILITTIRFDFDPRSYILALPLIGIMLASYLIILLSFFSKKHPKIPEIMNELNKIHIVQVKTNLNHQENDEEIIELDVNLKSANDKMEAYVLEAALFGALAFSGFLQLISSSNLSVQSLGLFTLNFFHLFEGLVNFSSESILNSFNLLMSKEGILSLIALLTLFCSVFFLAVIASRLRFNDLSDSIDKSLKLSKIYNDKEENLIYSNDGKSNETSNTFTKIIRKHLIKGNLTLEQTVPIMEFMRFFRTLGIMTFFVIVVSGGLFVSVQLSLILAFIMLLSFLFFKFSTIIKLFKRLSNQIGLFYFRIERKVFLLGLVLLTLCLLFRTINIKSDLSAFFTYFSFLIMISHFTFSLFIPERIQNTEINDSLFTNTYRNLFLLKKLLKISIAILLLGMLFKIMQLSFSNLILILGICFLSTYLIFSKKTLSDEYLSLFFRVTFSVLAILTIYFLLADFVLKVLVYISFFGLSTCILLTFLYRKKILLSTIYETVTFALFIILIQFSFFQFAFLNFSFNIEQYQNKIEADFISKKLSQKEYGQFLYAKSNMEKDSLKFYMNKMDKVISRDDIGPQEIDEFCCILDEHQTDTIIIKHALKWSIWVLSKNDYYKNYETTIYLLNKLGDYAGCIKLFNQMEKEKIEIDEDMKLEFIFIKTECLIKLRDYTKALDNINFMEKNYGNESEEFNTELKSLKQICLKNLSASN
ncbi:MAG: hypothetical protein ACKO7P_00205 [Bacteroidota bacterium]